MAISCPQHPSGQALPKESQDSTLLCPYIEAADAMSSHPYLRYDTGSETSCRMTKPDPVWWVCVDFYYEFSRQRADLLIYFFPSEITNAEHLPSGHLIEPMAA